ncbi:MAG: permease prefix domain 1-containing protein [Christensenellales bacterium]
MKAEEYLKEMSKEIHNREVRDCIIQEYRDHLEDAIEALLVKGMSEVEAEEEAVRQMGDPEVAGRDMGRLYSKVLDFKMLFFSGGLGSLGVSPSGQLRIHGIPSPSHLACLMECRRRFFIFSA